MICTQQKLKAIQLQLNAVRLLRHINTLDATLRRRLCTHPRLGLLLFSLYYFTNHITYPFSNTHLEYLFSLQDLLSEKGLLKALLVVGARNSGKTALATIALTHVITSNSQKYVTITTADPANSSGYLYSIRNTLLSNPYMIRDYGYLIPKSRIDKETGVVNRQKAEDFIAANAKRTRFEALSTQQSLRGRLYDGSRITALVLDDIETSASVRSELITEQISQQIKESENATADDHRILLLGNKLTNLGNVADLEKKYSNQANSKIIRLSLLDEEENIIWNTKYTHTQAEADFLNEKYNLNLQSVQSIKESNDSITFASDYLAAPLDSASAIFTKAMFQYAPESQIEHPSSPDYPTHIVVSLDTALTAKTTSDYTAMTIRYSNINQPHKHYISSHQYKILPDKLFELISNTYTTLRNKYPIANILFGWEKTHSTLSLHGFFRDYAKNKGLPITMYLLDPKNKKKEDRIIATLLHRYETKQIFHLTNNNNNLCENLERQLLLFPLFNKNDDQMDATAMGFSQEFITLTTPSQFVEMIPTTEKRQRENLLSTQAKRRGLLYRK